MPLLRLHRRSRRRLYDLGSTKDPGFSLGFFLWAPLWRISWETEEPTSENAAEICRRASSIHNHFNHDRYLNRRDIFQTEPRHRTRGMASACNLNASDQHRSQALCVPKTLSAFQRIEFSERTGHWRTFNSALAASGSSREAGI